MGRLNSFSWVTKSLHGNDQLEDFFRSQKIAFQFTLHVVFEISTRYLNFSQHFSISSLALTSTLFYLNVFSTSRMILNSFYSNNLDSVAFYVWLRQRFHSKWFSLFDQSPKLLPKITARSRTLAFLSCFSRSSCGVPVSSPIPTIFLRCVHHNFSGIIAGLSDSNDLIESFVQIFYLKIIRTSRGRVFNRRPLKVERSDF